MIHVAWPDWEARGSWDMAIVHELTAGDDFQHAKSVPLGEGAVVVIPGQHHVLHAAQWASEIERLPWALTIVTSDEEALFPVDLLPRDEKHAVFTQYHDRGMDRVIPIGARPGTTEILAQIGNLARMGDVFFAGQDTHERRHELLAALKDMACDTSSGPPVSGHSQYGNVAWAATTGFQQGLSQARYLAAMRDTRIAPCPSGPHSLDSFRLYEALAAGCLPVIETHTPHGDEGEFWDALFGPERPILRLASWTQGLPLIAEEYADGVRWRAKRDEVQEWWHWWQVSLTQEFHATIERLRQG